MLNLPSFNLEEYDPQNILHHSIIIELANELSVQKAFYDLENYINNIINSEDKINKVYIAFEQEDPIGFISISKIASTYQISYAILRYLRRKKKATTLLNEFTKMIFDTEPDIEKIVLFINKINTGSIVVAKSAGYIQENQTKYSISRSIK